MQKTYIPIFFTFIFFISSVHPSVNTIDLIIPENSTCEVRLGKSSHVILGHNESSETAVITCNSTKKTNNNNLNYLYTRLIRIFSKSYYFSDSPIGTKWEITSGSTENKAI